MWICRGWNLWSCLILRPFFGGWQPQQDAKDARLVVFLSNRFHTLPDVMTSNKRLLEVECRLEQQLGVSNCNSWNEDSTLHSLNLTLRPWKIGGAPRGNEYSNHPFSGAMLAYQRVNRFDFKSTSAKSMEWHLRCLYDLKWCSTWRIKLKWKHFEQYAKPFLSSTLLVCQ